jgi:hypothetical protein
LITPTLFVYIFFLLLDKWICVYFLSFWLKIFLSVFKLNFIRFLTVEWICCSFQIKCKFFLCLIDNFVIFEELFEKKSVKKLKFIGKVNIVKRRWKRLLKNPWLRSRVIPKNFPHPENIRETRKLKWSGLSVYFKFH